MIAVRQEQGSLVLDRGAVGDHILLGGDNMDLALAYAVRTRLADAKTQLDPWQFRGLTVSCRDAKERLLSTNESKHAVSILGRGRKVVGGCAVGEALVMKERISGWGGIDPRTGTVIETRHELKGVSFKDKVLVFPGAKGSSGWSSQFHVARLAGTAPIAMVFNEMTTKIALGAVVAQPIGLEAKISRISRV